MKTTTSFLLIAIILLSTAGASAAPDPSQRETPMRKDARELLSRSQREERPEAEARRMASALGTALLEQTIDPAEYILGPGDELIVSLIGTDSRTFTAIVLPEGDVFLPDIGSIRADGLTLEQFRADLAAVIGRYFRNIALFCFLRTPARFRVFVTGEVGAPGAVEASSVERVTDAIAKAGGTTDSGSWRLITVERAGSLIRTDLLAFLKQGDFANNPHLRAGDRIHVPPRGTFGVIYGEVKKPGWYEIIEGETILDLIDIAGGFTSDALRDSVVLARVAESGVLLSSTVPASRFTEPLQDKDEIGVFNRFKNRKFVHVEGAIYRTGRFFLAEDEGLTELIVRAGGFTPDADPTAAYIGRKDGTVVAVNLREYLAPAAAKNLLLRDGDVLAIPRIPKTVTVGGEVNNPGEFDYTGDLTVVQYIGLAGGPTKDGSIDRVVIYSPDGSVRSVARDTHPGRGDVIVVKRSYSRIFADLFRGFLSAGTLIVSVLILSQ